MHPTEAADAIREKLIKHRVSRTADLWSTILKQIAKQDSFDGKYVGYDSGDHPLVLEPIER